MTNLRLFTLLTALVNVLPEESRILQAPLAAEAGGWGLWREGAWPSVAEPGYVRMRELGGDRPAGTSRSGRHLRPPGPLPVRLLLGPAAQRAR